MTSLAQTTTTLQGMYDALLEMEMPIESVSLLVRTAGDVTHLASDEHQIGCGGRSLFRRTQSFRVPLSLIDPASACQHCDWSNAVARVDPTEHFRYTIRFSNLILKRQRLISLYKILNYHSSLPDWRSLVTEFSEQLGDGDPLWFQLKEKVSESFFSSAAWAVMSERITSTALDQVADSARGFASSHGLSPGATAEVTAACVRDLENSVTGMALLHMPRGYQFGSLAGSIEDRQRFHFLRNIHPPAWMPAAGFYLLPFPVYLAFRAVEAIGRVPVAPVPAGFSPAALETVLELYDPSGERTLLEVVAAVTALEV